MKTNTVTLLHTAILAAAACGFSSCASFEHPLARHDMDGDRVISKAEFQQQHMQYNLAGVQRADEYSRARLVTAHVENATDLIGHASHAKYLLANFGQ